jgi:hypothetical protein
MSEVPDTPEMSAVRSILDRMMSSCGFVENSEPYTMTSTTQFVRSTEH